MASRDAVVADVLTAVGRLRALGYVIGLGAVDVLPDCTVIFHMSGDGQVLVSDLADVGFARAYELDLRPARHQVHPR